MTAEPVIELRSDTFTEPTEAMRAAMAAAPVGDDGYREDPTVRALEDLAAERLGKHAACLMPSGTMANLCAVLVAVPPGGTVVLGADADLHLDELRGAERFGAVRYVTVTELADGTLDPALVRAATAGPPDLVCAENTHNRRSGSAWGTEPLHTLRRLGAPVHLDGARLFNAEAALGIPAADLAAAADTVQVCLSKGLSAPVGSILAGTAETIEAARQVRRALGGGMRQAGVLAAAGIVALREMTGRLADDHDTAALLAGLLAEIPGVTVDRATTPTNIVMITLAGADAPTVARAARDRGVYVTAFTPHRLRAVTHRGVDRPGAERAARVLGEVIRRPATRRRRAPAASGA
jgi:threonine aldolase